MHLAASGTAPACRFLASDWQWLDYTLETLRIHKPGLRDRWTAGRESSVSIAIDPGNPHGLR
jgi:hypothetical protein